MDARSSEGQERARRARAQPAREREGLGNLRGKHDRDAGELDLAEFGRRIAARPVPVLYRREEALVEREQGTPAVRVAREQIEAPGHDRVRGLVEIEAEG